MALLETWEIAMVDKWQEMVGIETKSNKTSRRRNGEWFGRDIGEEERWLRG